MLYLSEQTVALLQLRRQPWNNDALRRAERLHLDADAFAAIVLLVTGDEIVTCESCDRATFSRSTIVAPDGRDWCENCYSETFGVCESCGEDVWRDDLTYALDQDWCEYCRDRHLSWCENCDAYYETDNPCCEEGCDCEAPNLRFRFPANGAGFIRENERLEVTLPAGVVSDEGLRAIRDLLAREVFADCYSPRSEATKILDQVGPDWQGKRGNMTRRISSAIYKARNLKVPPAVLTEVGNLARLHSADTATWRVEVTRDLNLSAEAFCHGGSCWWQSHYESRCALKSWGGLGLRVFDEYDEPTGRAWVQPLDEDLQPTHDAENAHAYIVYNAYGDLTGYVAARIVAHLSGKTYRRVSFDAAPQWVNDDIGFLVADPQACAETSEVSFGYDPHDRRDACEHAFGMVTA